MKNLILALFVTLLIAGCAHKESYTVHEYIHEMREKHGYDKDTWPQASQDKLKDLAGY
jgi:hypothetical protein